MAGDPLQLGPVIRCKVAEKYNLGRSFLERLMSSCEVYQRQDGKFDPRVLTRLVRNYRSHPAIVNLPSRLFYDSDLEVNNNFYFLRIKVVFAQPLKLIQYLENLLGFC